MKYKVCKLITVFIVTFVSVCICSFDVSSETTSNIETPDTATLLDKKAELYLGSGRYAEAERLYKHSLAIREKTLGFNHRATASSLNNLANLYEKTGRYAEAELFFKRVLAFSEITYGADHNNTGIIENNLANLYISTGRYAEAEPLIKHAIAISEKHNGPDHPGTASSLNILASLYKTTNRYSEAEALFKRALAIRLKSLGSYNRDTTESLGNLAEFYQTIGHYSEAEPLLKHSLTIIEKSSGPKHPDTAAVINNLALIYTKTSRYSEAEPLFKRSLAILENSFGSNHPQIALALNNLGMNYYKKGDYAEAEPILKRSLAISEKSLGQDHPHTATLLTNLANLHRITSHYTEADSLLKQALIAATVIGQQSLLSRAQIHYSKLSNDLSCPFAAIFFAKQSINNIQFLRKNVSTLGRETQKHFDKTIEDDYHYLSDLLIAQGRLAEAQQVLDMLKEEEYFNFIRRDSGTSYNLNTRATFISIEEPWNREYEILTARTAKLGKEIGELRKIGKEDPLTDINKKRLEKLLEENKKASQDFSDFLTKLKNGLKASSSTKENLVDIGAKDIVGLKELQNSLTTLGSGTVFLDYTIVDDGLSIILTTPDTQLVRHVTIKAAELSKKIFKIRENITNNKIDPRPLAKDLYSILIAPVAKDLETFQAKTLMLSLVGALRYLPFGVLHNGTSYVVENYRTVVYASVAKDKVFLPVRSDWQVAALGVSEKVHADFAALPEVVNELQGIVRSGTGGIIPGEILMNKSFTENTMRESANRNSVTHIASHFKFVPGSDRDSFLLLGDGTTMSLDKIRNGSFFQESELLTLSACETAIGTSGNGVEIEGFGAIAMNQGAKSVIASLWSVSDKSTALLMKEFYRLKEEKKLPKIEALRQAQLALMKGFLQEAATGNNEERGSGRKRYEADTYNPYSHPYYWAPFILMGNWK